MIGAVVNGELVIPMLARCGTCQEPVGRDVRYHGDVAVVTRWVHHVRLLDLEHAVEHVLPIASS